MRRFPKGHIVTPKDFGAKMERPADLPEEVELHKPDDKGKPDPETQDEIAPPPGGPPPPPSPSPPKPPEIGG